MPFAKAQQCRWLLYEGNIKIRDHESKVKTFQFRAKNLVKKKKTWWLHTRFWSWTEVSNRLITREFFTLWVATSLWAKLSLGNDPSLFREDTLLCPSYRHHGWDMMAWQKSVFCLRLQHMWVKPWIWVAISDPCLDIVGLVPRCLV